MSNTTSNALVNATRTDHRVRRDLLIPDHSRRVVIGEHDLPYLRHIYRFGVATQPLLCRTLHAPVDVVNKKTRRYFDARLVVRHMPPLCAASGGGVPFVYVPGPALAELAVAQRWEADIETARQRCAGRVVPSYLSHACGVQERLYLDLRDALQTRSPEMTLAEFRVERECLTTYEARPAGDDRWVRHTVRPDAYALLRHESGPSKGGGSTHLFLEYDRCTVSVRSFAAKASSFAHFRESGAFTRFYDAPATFQVAVVTTGGMARVRQLHAAAAAAGAGDLFAVATEEDEAVQGLSGPVWFRDSDRAATFLV